MRSTDIFYHSSWKAPLNVITMSWPFFFFFHVTLARSKFSSRKRYDLA